MKKSHSRRPHTQSLRVALRPRLMVRAHHHPYSKICVRSFHIGVPQTARPNSSPRRLDRLQYSLDKIPPEARIPVIDEGTPRPVNEVRSESRGTHQSHQNRGLSRFELRSCPYIHSQFLSFHILYKNTRGIPTGFISERIAPLLLVPPLLHRTILFTTT